MTTPYAAPMCAFECTQTACGVVPRDHPDHSRRGLPICPTHVQELLPLEHDGARYIQMFGALHADYTHPQGVLW